MKTHILFKPMTVHRGKNPPFRFVVTFCRSHGWSPILFVLLTTSVACFAQAQPTNSATAASDTAAVAPPSAAAKRSAADLEKLAQPIALHPDPLIAVLLPAAVYPLEIVQAARFIKDTNNIPKVDEQAWDENVKAVAKFPELVAKMDADLPWTVELGQAFLDQPKELMDTIQALRGKAHKAGTLQNSAQQVVTVTNIVVMQTNITEVVRVTNQIVQVQPSNPEVVYVPSYPPTVYYPPPAYVYNPVAPLVTFGAGMAWGAILANNCDWGHGDIDVDIDHNVNRNVDRNVDRNVNRNQNVNRTSQTSAGGKQKWQPDQSRLNKSGAPAASTQSREARGYGGGAQTAQRSAGAGGTPRASQPSSTARASQTPRASQPSSTPRASSSPTSAQRPASSSAGSRSPSPSQSSVPRSSPSAGSRSPSSSSSAFGGMNSGGGSRDASSRGAASRGGGGARGGGGRR